MNDIKRNEYFRDPKNYIELGTVDASGVYNVNEVLKIIPMLKVEKLIGYPICRIIINTYNCYQGLHEAVLGYYELDNRQLFNSGCNLSTTTILFIMKRTEKELRMG